MRTSSSHLGDGSAVLEHLLADELSHTDVLTGLPNRRRLGVDLKAEVARSVRYLRPIAFVMIDVDHFKTVNDAYGHQAGDEILSEFGTAFKAALRATDTAYRFGGDEFCVLLRETDGESAEVVAERIRIGIAAQFAGEVGLPTVTASLGVAAFPSNAIDVEALIAAADQALYAAKEAGRNCVVRATNRAGHTPRCRRRSRGRRSRDPRGHATRDRRGSHGDTNVSVTFQDAGLHLRSALTVDGSYGGKITPAASVALFLARACT